jgi:hypothetical protein
LQVDITFQRRAAEAGAPALPFLPLNVQRALAGALYMPNTDLLQRPGDGAISGSIGIGVREFLLIRVQGGVTWLSVDFQPNSLSSAAN